MLGLVGKAGQEPEITLEALEEVGAKGKDALVEFVKDKTGKTAKSITKLLDLEIPKDDPRWLPACLRSIHCALSRSPGSPNVATCSAGSFTCSRSEHT